MENINVKKFRNIIITIIITIIVIICSYFLIKNYKEKVLKEKLVKDGYKEIVKNIYNKIDNEKNYTFNVNNRSFTKTIANDKDNVKENININKENNIITILYNYHDNNCFIDQKGTYDDTFKCEIIKRRNNCKTKCDIMLKYIKSFEKEAKKYQ